MSAPFIFIGNNRLKAGKLESYERDFVPDLVNVVETKEPRILAFHSFANEEGTEVAGVQVHPDAESMMFHMGVVTEYVSMAYGDNLEATTGIQVYGPPSDAALEMIRKLLDAGG